MKMWLVTGLGNPEGKYFNTWHNLGFLAAEKFAGEKAKFQKKSNQSICNFKIGDNKVFVLKPLTYMNLSGQAVLAVCRKYKIETQNLIVFADDIYTDIGKIRIITGGGSSGHNGIKSICELLKTKDFIRIKIGAKPTGELKGNTADYVLSKIDADISKPLAAAAAAAADIIGGTALEKVKGKYNERNVF